MSAPYAHVSSAHSASNVLAKTIAVPAIHKPVRVPSFPNLERTAVMSGTNTFTISVVGMSAPEYDSTGAASDGDIRLLTDENTDGCGLLVRSATFPLWLGRWIGSPSLKTSIGVFCSFADLGITPLIAGPGDQYIFPPRWVSGYHSVNANQYERIYPLGSAANNDWVYVPPSISGKFTQTVGDAPVVKEVRTKTYAEVTLVSGISTATCILTVESHNGGNFTTHAVTGTLTGGNLVRFTLGTDIQGKTVAGWIRPIKITADAISHSAYFQEFRLYTTGETTSEGGGSALPFGPLYMRLPACPPPEISKSHLPYESCRSTAAAVLFSNVTSVLNKEGTVGAIRLPKDETAVWTLRDPYTAYVSDVKATDRYFGPLEKGFYAFTTPDASSEVFRDCVQHTLRTGTKMVVFHLDSFDYVAPFRLSDLNTGNSTTMAVTVSRHLEFRSTTSLFPTDFSRASLESYHLAQMAIARTGTFYENPVHLATIARAVLNGVKALYPVVKPYVAPAAAAVGNALLAKIQGPAKAPQQKKKKPAKPRAKAKGRK